MQSAFSSLQTCLDSKKIVIPSQEEVLKYIEWCYNTKNYKFSTINSYISCLATLFKLKDVNIAVFTSFKTKTALRGVRNLDEIKANCKKPRKVFSFELLQILGHMIAIADWNDDSKRVFWTAACTRFFGSFRISELLASSENFFDPLTTLLWSDISFFHDSVRIFVKSPKIFKQGGISVDLFKCKNSNVCPFTLLQSLKKSRAMQNPNDPVFIFKNRKLLTPAAFNKTIRDLLVPIF
jgi:hypothetical protein